MPESKFSDMGFLTWAMGALITIILFLLGFGVKDARSNLSKIPELVAAIKALEATVCQLEKRIERLERERDG
jgi:cell division protein FtsB